MAVTADRKFTRQQVFTILEGAKGKTLGEVDKSRQFARTEKSDKITGIAGDVVEQSVFGYKKDSLQESDIEIDGIRTEIKATGVRVPKGEMKLAKGKTGEAYNIHLGAKEGISVTHVTFDPTIQTDFMTSHFWEKSEHLLIVFYEYKSYDVVPASAYSQFPIVDYCYNKFSDEERNKLKNDWEIVRDYLQPIYDEYKNVEERNAQLVGFTHILRPNLMLIKLNKISQTIPSNEHQNNHHRLTPSTFQQSYLDSLVADIHQSKMYRYHRKAILHSSTYDNVDTPGQIQCYIQKLSNQDYLSLSEAQRYEQLKPSVFRHPRKRKVLVSSYHQHTGLETHFPLIHFLFCADRIFLYQTDIPTHAANQVLHRDDVWPQFWCQESA